MTCAFCGGTNLWNGDQNLNNRFLTYFKILKDDCMGKYKGEAEIFSNENRGYGCLTINYQHVDQYFKDLFKKMNINKVEVSDLQLLIGKTNHIRAGANKCGKTLSQGNLPNELNVLERALSSDLVVKLQDDNRKLREQNYKLIEKHELLKNRQTSVSELKNQIKFLSDQNKALQQQVESYKNLADQAIRKIRQCSVDVINIKDKKEVFDEKGKRIIGSINNNNLQNVNRKQNIFKKLPFNMRDSSQRDSLNINNINNESATNIIKKRDNDEISFGV